MGFAKRVFPKRDANYHHATKTAMTNDADAVDAQSDFASAAPNIGAADKATIRTEITFDFHRLNVLVLRAVKRDNFSVGRKVGTFTMSEAKIHATLGAAITVEGSLGGLQVIDLTPEGVSHQRILSVGKDPLTEPTSMPAQDLLSSLTQEVYGCIGLPKTEFSHEAEQALSFFVSRDLTASVTIRIRMASVWYTHCARFMQELSWCATEFKHYLK